MKYGGSYLLVGAAFMALTLVLSIVATVKTRPTIQLAQPVPAVLPAGFLCTYPAARFETLNATCHPTSFNDTVTLDYCRDRRNSTDIPCVIAACTPYVTQQVVNFYDVKVTHRAFSIAFGKFQFYNTNKSDLGAVRIAQVLQEFVTENRPDAVSPLLLPPPQPLLTDTPNYSVAQFNTTSFQIGSREFARQFVVFDWNYHANQRAEMAPTDRATVASQSVVTPARCPYADVAALPWLQGNNVTLRAVFNLAFQMILFNSTGTVSYATPTLASVAEWPAYCAHRIGGSAPTFCAAFPSYYSYESLNNFTVIPSPYRDITSLLTAYNEEYADCGPARGCFGFGN